MIFRVLSFITVLLSIVKGCHWKHRCRSRNYDCTSHRLIGIDGDGFYEDGPEISYSIQVAMQLMSIRLHPAIIQCTVDYVDEKFDIPKKMKSFWEKRIKEFLTSGIVPDQWLDSKETFCNDHDDICFVVEVCMLQYSDMVQPKLMNSPYIAFLKSAFGNKAAKDVLKSKLTI